MTGATILQSSNDNYQQLVPYAAGYNMVTYNHPLSYSGPEIEAILTARNEVNAPIHLVLTETTTTEYRLKSPTILYLVDSRSEKFACKNLPSSFSASDLISPTTVAYLGRLQKKICICYSVLTDVQNKTS